MVSLKKPIDIQMVEFGIELVPSLTVYENSGMLIINVECGDPLIGSIYQNKN